MKNRVELHLHSYYSLMDGLNSPDEYASLAAEFGMPALALTDHGTLSGHREFQSACRDHGVKPILGVEAYISPTDRFDRRPVAKREDNTQLYHHVGILAKNQAGLENLHRLSREAWESGYYHKPRIDFELLEENAGDLIILSGCMSGLVAKSILNGDLAKAEHFAAKFKSVFGDDFYMEVQAHNEDTLNDWLLAIADKYSIKPVATTDCHFTRPELRWVEEAMLILSTSPKANKEHTYESTKHIEDIFERFNAMYPERPISFEEIDVYMMNRQELQDAFHDVGITREDIYENTLEIADAIGDYDYVENLDLLPHVADNPDTTLRGAVFDGLDRRGLSDNQDYVKRAEHELEIIADKNFSTYFLVVQDIVDWCKQSDILVGPGRGSAAGSLVCYALGITQVDPLEYGLLFSRFVDPERDDYPDIDMDFQKSRRPEVKEYIRRRYGHVASISNFIYFKDKGVVRDAARVFGVPIVDVNKALEKVESWEGFVEDESTRWFREKYPEVQELADHLRGRIRSVGMHAAGVVTSNHPIEEIAPIETRKDPDNNVSGRVPVVAWDMKQCAAAGFIKLDILGLNNLDVIQETRMDIPELANLTQEELYSLPLDDNRVYEQLSKGQTVGVFQADAKPYRSLLQEMGVDNFRELAASNALVRPGARNTIGDSYIKRKHGKELVRHIHPMTEEILDETFGLPVYQEDVMLLAQALGSFTGGEANRLRQIIGKKKDVSEFKPYRDKFVKNASQHISEKEAEELWRAFEEHAKYSFNKSHAVSYSLISYLTAWLKMNYPQNFMASLFRNEGDKDKRVEVLIEMRRMGLTLLLPHINKSDKDLSIQGDSLRMGLTDIKYISDKVFAKLDKHRPFNNYGELLEKADEKGSGISTRTIGAISAVGAAHRIGGPKGDESNYYEYLGIPKFKSTLDPEIQQHITDISEFNESDVFILKGFVKGIKRNKPDSKTKWARVEMLDETGTCGVFHQSATEIEPGNMYVFLVARNRIMKYVQIDEFRADNPDPFVQALYHGVDVQPGKLSVIAAEKRFTKARKMMATVVFMNEKGEMRRALVFPSLFAKKSALVREGKHVRASFKRLDDGGLMASVLEE